MTKEPILNSDKQKVAKIREILGFKLNEETKFITLGPSEAVELLKFNTNNRRLSRAIVLKYARAMRNGEWVRDNSAITFSPYGELSNGQHRLNAIVESGQHVPVLIALNVNNFSEMDRGKNRTICDNITTDYRFKDTDIATSRDIQQIATVLTRMSMGKSKIDINDVIKVLERYGDDLLFLKEEGLFKGVSGLSSKAISAALFVAFENGVELELLKRIRSILSSGLSTNLEDAPIIGLRDKLITFRGGGSTLEKETYKYTMYCVDAVERRLTRKTCRLNEPKYILEV